MIASRAVHTNGCHEKFWRDAVVHLPETSWLKCTFG